MNDDIINDSVSLTGKGFFRLTRRMIFAVSNTNSFLKNIKKINLRFSMKMAGTVVTYELVLLNQVHKDPEKINICNITNYDFA